MAKFLIQDIMPPEKRRPKTDGLSEREEPHSGVRHDIRHETEEHVIHSGVETRREHEPRERGESADIPPSERPDLAASREPWTMPSGPSRWGWSNRDFGLSSQGSGIGAVVKALIVCAIILGAYFAYATLTGKAEVVITPRTEVITLPPDTAFSAKKEPQSGELGYSVMRFSLTESVEVPATGSKTVSEKASGRIIVYNDFSTTPQRLIKNTRFESPTGKIYRINESIVVPGMKKDGTKTIPGSIEVTVYADEPGPEYNSEPTDFTIPGFKSDPARYKGFYARSNGPLAGGANGTVKTVSEEDLRKAANELRVALETKLRTKARGNLSKDQVLFDAGIVMDFAEPKLAQGETTKADTAIVERTATLAAVVFDHRALARVIAQKGLGANYHGEPVSLKNANDLVFSMKSMTPDALFESSNIEFGLTGSAKLVWIVDPKAIAELLRGVEERSFNDIMAKEEGSIDTAVPVLRPFWRSAYPEDPSQIVVTIKESE